MSEYSQHSPERIIEAVFEGTSRATGEDFFRELVRCLCELLEVKYAFVGQYLKSEKVRTIAVWAKGKEAANFDYQLADTPCREVIGQNTCIFPQGVQTRFPNDQLLVEMGVDSYLGTPLRDAQGKPNGLLVVLDDKPMREETLLKRVLEVFAARAGSEIGRREAERQSHRFEQILAATNDMMSFLSPDYVYLAVNEAYLANHGKKREEIVGHSVPELMGQEVFEEKLAGRLERCLAGETIRFQGWFEYPASGRRFVEVAYYPAWDGDQQIGGIIACVHDLTERRQDEMALENSKIMFSQAFDSSPSLMTISSRADGRFLAVNDSFCRVLGYEREEVLGKSFLELDLKLEGIEIDWFFKRLETSGMVEQIEIRVRARDGQEIMLLAGGSEIMVEGQPCILSSAEDITARKQAEAALEKRVLALTQPLSGLETIDFEELFNLEDVQRLQDDFSSAMGVASIITRTDGSPITEPSNFCRLCRDVIRQTELGCQNCYKSDAVLGQVNLAGPIVQPCLSGGLWDAGTSISVGGKHLANWLIGQVRDETQTESKMLEYAREIGANEEEFLEAFREVPAMSREQFERVAQVLFTLASQLSHTAYQNITQARFITERKEAEEKSQKLEGQLRQVQKMEAVGQLAGGVAHDFNNILQAILGYGEMAQIAEGEGEPVGEYLQEILAASDRARTLVSQLLAFSRRQVLDLEPLDLNEVIADLLKMLRRIIGEHVVLEFMPGHNLGLIQGDRGQMGQVLTNLCVNARDAMIEGGTITIEVENVRMDEAYCQGHPWATPGRYIQLSVTDTGCGMDTETSARVFEPFYTTKGVNQGTGLGLATAYGLVKQHGGDIEVYSEPGLGTTFKVYLPVVERQAGSVGHKIEGPVPHGHETILLAEDDPLVLGVAKTFLEGAGYTVLTALDGQQAVDVFAASASAIDLVILDVVMPKLGGRSAGRKIHELSPDLPLLYCSGYSTNAVHTNFILEEGLVLIQKPYHRDDLLRKVREVLNAGGKTRK